MQYLTAAIGFVFCFASCADDSSSLTIYRMTSSDLEKSNALILDKSACHLQSLNKKLWDVSVQAPAEIWQPVAVKAHAFSNEIIKYLDTLILTMAKNREEDKSSVSNVLSINTEGGNLFKKLKNYESDLVELFKPYEYHDPSRFINLPVIGFEAGEDNVFIRQYFTDIPSIAAIAMLRNIENQVRTTEYEILKFCDNNSTSINCGYYEEFSPLVSQTSTNVKVGEPIEITAGIGAFSRAAQPHITINGKELEVNKAAVAVYKLQTNVEPGVYRFPVKMEYYLPDGQKQSYSRYLYFTVEK